ncbi:ROK family protein [Radiobacillus deserti]|uniref:ROK family protein n=1 Tax=Radiobacillus deserti TaxID=2594883 RepID=A0A516KKS9_9BACI|nr:ROK family protein [Radiobacillus deserti]QDP41996.1 ROK family protein [Radiobacillus deserti]
MNAVGVDIGGTKVAIAVVETSGRILKEDVIPTDKSVAPSEMIDRINQKIEELIKETRMALSDIKGIGIGSPGPLDSKNGIITYPPNLENWRNVPIVQQVKEYFNIPVTLENDANAAAMAEKWLGAAKENEDFAYMTISTGIGAGIFAEGKLLGGSRGNAGDIGHTVVDPSYGQCPCGQYGCLEYIASGTAIARRGSELAGEELTTQQVFERYHAGDEVIKPYINDVFRIIGVACVSVINTLDPEKIIIGGGVSKVGEPLFKAVRDYVSQYALNPDGRKTEIVPAQLDQNAGVVGAAGLCLNQ